MHRYEPDDFHFRRFRDRLHEAAYTVLAPLAATVYVTREPLPFAQRTRGEKRTPAVGESWGDLFDCGWFRFTGRVPASAKGADVVLLVDVNGEGLFVDDQGRADIAVTCLSSQYDYRLGMPGKRVVPILARAKGGERVDRWMDASLNDLFGNRKNDGKLAQADIAARRMDIVALAYDVEVLEDLARAHPAGSVLRERLQHALGRAERLTRDYAPETVAAARAILAPELARRGGDGPVKLSAIGHAHMDLAWLWPVRETRRKVGRTFATALRMIERYPDYVFGATQPQQYAWLKEDYPDLYARVKKRIAEGRIEPVGAMWVESDTNLVGGESLVRQLLYGKRFFRKEFGRDMNTLWLPDVFGYNAALPQIMKKAGVDYFTTIKLSWSRKNRFPHNTFWWQGIDGSRVLAHMPPEDTYNSAALPHSLLKSEHDYREKAVGENALVLYGIGDGGGGPGEEHLERLAREKNLYGLPPTKQEPSAAFFDRLGREAVEWPVWSGELYLEFHQGTLTSQGRNKRGNRQMEYALRSADLAAARRDVFLGRDAGDPKLAERLETLWKETLLYQFHDILPGSSIKRVYDESRARYAEMLAEAEALTLACDREAAARVCPEGGDVLVNDGPWERGHWVKHGRAWRRVTVPALGMAAAVPTPEGGQAKADGIECDALLLGRLKAEPRMLSNGFVTVEFAADGAITSCINHANDNTELIAGPANTLSVYDDDGDGWDFPTNYRARAPRRFKLQKTDTRIDGPRAVVTQVYVLDDSTLTQEISLTAGETAVAFATTVDWRERGAMLRTAFPTTIHADEVRCDVPFGHYKRPTHENTSWDFAREEIACRQWIDLAEYARGVALLNNGKYGHRVRDGVLEMALLRASSFPDPEADAGRHEFTYALLPHEGDLGAGFVNREAYALNTPIRTVRVTHADPPKASGAVGAGVWLYVDDRENIVVETVKRAEDDPRAFIVRLYEANGETTRATLRPGFPASAAIVDLMEENPKTLRGRHAFTLDFKPFEIITLRLRRR